MVFWKRHETKDIFTEIFEKVYSKLECNLIYVFLCGGACENGSNQIRNDIKELLEKESNNKIKVLYPEELFFEKDKKSLTEIFKEDDLLHLETILAHNSNIVCIICESFGSATELGAFTNYKKIDDNVLLDKIVAVTYEEYEKDKPSFISEGPIKRIIQHDKKTGLNKFKLYKYTKDTPSEAIPKLKKDLTEELIDEFHKICIKNNKNSELNRIFLKESLPLNNFIGLSYLILLLIYFYEKLNNMELLNIIKIELNKLKILDFSEEKKKDENKKFDMYYKLSKRFLFEIQDFLIEDKNKQYCLTNKGLNHIRNNILNPLGIKIMDIDYIRMRIMHNQLYKKIKKGDYAS